MHATCIPTITWIVNFSKDCLESVKVVADTAAQR